MSIRRRIAHALSPILALGMLSALTLPTHSQAAPAKMAPATGRVHYKMTGPTMNGTIVMAWLEHGKKFRQDMKMSMKMQGQSMKADGWTLADGTYLYSHQQTMGNQVMRMKMPKNMTAASIPGMPNPAAAGKSTVIGQGKVLGYLCQIHRIGAPDKPGQGKVWLWKGMPLRVETKGPNGEGMTMVATRVETSPRLSQASFKVPSGMKIQDMQMPTGGRPGAAGRPR
jgi:hypothetical protein